MELKSTSSSSEMEVDEDENEVSASPPQSPVDQSLEIPLMESSLEQNQPPLKIIIPEDKELTILVTSTPITKLIKNLLTDPKPFTKLTTSLPVLHEKTDKHCQKLSSNPEKKQKLLNSQTFSCSSDFFKSFLKTGMKDLSYLHMEILNSIFSLAEGLIDNPILGIQMILTHSKAEDIFLAKQKSPPEESLSNLKTSLLTLWHTLTKSFSLTSKSEGTESDAKTLKNSVSYLLQMYNATKSPSDLQIFSIIKLYTSKSLKIPIESMPLFGPKCFESVTPNPLYAHSIRANSILSILNDAKAFQTAINLDEDHYELPNKEFYDIRFLLPLLTHVLDEKNICDVVKVISNGWIYFIARGLGLKDSVLRNCALLSYKRLIFNLQLTKGFRLQDVKIWLHFLEGVKIGMSQLEECRLSNLLSVWMVAICQVFKTPSHLMYSKVTHFLLAKPAIDLTILPDFVPFFVSGDGNKAPREWILDVLLKGLKTKSDWAIAKKVPTIKYMCLAFPLESITTQRTILKILANGSKIAEVAHDLVDRHCLLLWISNVPIDDKTYYRRELEDVFKFLNQNCPKNYAREQLFNFVANKMKWNLTS